MAAQPPFGVQILVRAEAQDGQLAFQFLADAASCFQHVQLIGPMPGLIEKRQGRFRFMLVLQSDKRKHLHEQLRLALPAITAMPLASKVRWSVDVDPTDFS